MTHPSSPLPSSDSPSAGSHQAVLPAVSAVVVNWNAREHLLRCLQSLQAEDLDEIIVVDNASVDGSVAAVKATYQGVVVISTGANLGFGAAANRGIAATSSQLVAIMNPDVLVGPGSIKALVEALQRDPEVAVLGPRIDNLNGSWYPSARSFPSLGDALGHAFLHFVIPHNRFSRRYRLLDWDHASGTEVDWVSGTFMLARRAALEAVGGFDESYFMYVEDVDLCWRLHQAGWRVRYEPAGRVVHSIGVSSELAPYRMILAHHRSLLRFATHSSKGMRRTMLPLVAAGLALRAALACLQRALRRRPPAAL